MKSSNEAQNAPSESATRRQARPYSVLIIAMVLGLIGMVLTMAYGILQIIINGDCVFFIIAFTFWTLGGFAIYKMLKLAYPLLLFFLSAVCFQTSMAAPTPLINQNGDLLPQSKTLASRLNAGKEVRENDACPPSQNLQQAPLVSRFLNEIAGVFYTSGTDYILGVVAEFADAPGLTAGGTTARAKSSMGVRVPPSQTSACSQSKPRSNVSEYPKLSVAETYARLLGVPRYFSIEPPKLEGNRFR